MWNSMLIAWLAFPIGGLLALATAPAVYSHLRRCRQARRNRDRAEFSMAMRRILHHERRIGELTSTFL